MMEEKIKILVVDDSIMFRQFLMRSLEEYPRFQIVGYAVNAYDAERKIKLLKPDVLTLDIEMPGISGIEFLKKQMAEAPIRVILVSSLNMNVFTALSCGALDFVKKPDMAAGNDRERFISSLAVKIMTASKARLKMAGSLIKDDKKAMENLLISGKKLTNKAINSTIIAIGASTGGTEAILSVLKDLPEKMPGIVVTQHMPEGFTKMYAERLDRLCRLSVKEAEHGDTVLPGHVYIAPGNMQMSVVRTGMNYSVACVHGERVSGHCPSVDVLFNSVARCAGKNAVGIIMTGMGQDGAYGLLEMRKKGAFTIGQDKASCVVYGMPMVANKIGAVMRQVSCANIPSVLTAYLQKL